MISPRWLACTVSAAIWLSGAVWVSGKGAPLFSQGLPFGSSKAHVTWKLSVSPETAGPGDTVVVVARYELLRGWHLYAPDFVGTGLATELSVDSPLVEVKGKPEFPPPQIKTVPILEETQRLLAGKGEIKQSVSISENAPPGGLEFHALLTYMTCSDDLCDPPTTNQPHPLSLRITAAASEDGAETAAAASGSDAANPFATMDIWAYIGVMISAGLVALILPCTYPMIPITIGFFAHQAEARKGSVLPLALAYGVGIILSFNIIGLVVGPLIIPIAASPWFNLAMFLLFFAFGLSFLGLFSITLPAAVTNMSSKASSATGYLGVFLLGATLVVASFACTLPILGTVLAITANEGSLGRVSVGMTAFGATMATPFVLLALFPTWVRSMPRSGEWMQTVKVFLGFVLVASSMAFFAKADQSWELAWLARETCLVLWAATFAVGGLYLLGIVRLKDEEAGGIGPVRLLVGILCLWAALYFVLGANGARLNGSIESFLPGYSLAQSGGVANQSTEPDRPIETEIDKGLQLARDKGLKALVNFSGVNCTNCKLMERNVFPTVTDLMANFVEIRLKTDHGDHQKEKKAYQQRLAGTPGIPVYVIVDPTQPDKPLAKYEGNEVPGKKRFADFLRENID